MIRNLLKKILPRRLIDSITRFRSAADRTVLSMVHRSSILTDLYYLVTRNFSDEHLAVLKGRKAYYESLRNIGSSCALLRRNIHRLEKGLIMRPRRDIFAEGFIEETVNCYCEAVKASSLENDELKWATDVLEQYFDVVGESPVTTRAKRLYVSVRVSLPVKLEASSTLSNVTDKFSPYCHQKLPKTDVDFDALMKLFVRRRSVRWYDDKPVPYDLLVKAASAASLAPSACNRQPYRFLFCNSKEKVVAIAKCAGGTDGFAANLPAIIAIVGDLSSYPFDRDRHLIYIDGSLAAMQMMLALETLGLSSCPINWPEVVSRERKIRNIVKLEDYERVIMLMAVGYADRQGGIPYSQKKTDRLILEDIS